MDSLIKIDGGEIFDKLAAAIGWLANKKTPKMEAVETYIKEIENTDYDPLIKAALISHARQTIKEFANQNDIMQLACQHIRKDADPEKVEPDWMNLFASKAKLVSSSDFQEIWGRVLARECNEPESIPRGLLHILEEMDRDDALAFTAICRIAVRLNDEYAPFIPLTYLHDIMSLIGINYDKLVNLNALGLINMDLDVLGSNQLCADAPKEKVVYFEKEYELSDEKRIDVGNVIFTKAGQALCHSIEVEPIEGFWETYCLPYWKDRAKKKRKNSQD